MFDVSLAQANWWFDAFNVILFLSALVVAVATYGSAQMAAVKERFSDERTAANEAETARANERAAGLEREAALAKERTAQLDMSVADANKKAAEAQLALERFKAPRSIDGESERRLIASLQKFPNTFATLWLWNGAGTEGSSLAGRLRSILSTSNWKVSGPNALMGSHSEPGIIIAIRRSPDPGDAAAAKALHDELQEVGIASQLQHGVTDDPVSVLGAYTGPGSDYPTSNVWVVIGSKP